MSISFNSIKAIIEASLKDLYKKDKHLILNGDDVSNANKNHVSERGIVHKFGVYLEKHIEKYHELTKYNIDVEYNRDGSNIKRLPGYPNGVYPDLIIHKRGTNKDNLLILEFKPWWNNEIDNDLNKVEEFIDQDGQYAYKYGCVITIEKNKPIYNWL
jgi:hypothetical protein